MISIAYDALDSRPTIFADLDDGIHSQLKSLGISSTPIRMPGDHSWAVRDTEFAGYAMPGSLDFEFQCTTLPAWKVLSLDRFSFWYRGRQARLEYEAVMGLNWDNAIVPLSLHHPLPWRIAKDKPVMAVQVEPLRTRAWRDWLSRPVPYTKVFVSSQRDADFIKQFYVGEIHLIPAGDNPVGTKVSADEKKEARKGLNISDGARVGLVLFDSQTEWEFRKHLGEIVSVYNHLLIYPLTQNDRRNLRSIGVVNQANIRIVDSLAVEPAADEVIMFRYDDRVIPSRRVPVRIVDSSERWDSALLAQ